MPYQLTPFADVPLDEPLLEALIAEHESLTLPRLARLWNYYRNALADPTSEGGSSGPPSQAAGLPSRLREDEEQPRQDERFSRELVIENDIAWRIHTLVDFMFPDSPRIVSQARDAAKAQQIQNILEAVFTANGGTALWQDAALLGAVYGSVDFMLTCDRLSALKPSPNAGTTGNPFGFLAKARNEDASGNGPLIADPAAAESSAAVLTSLTSPGDAPSEPVLDDLIARIGSSITIETIEAPRAIPLLNQHDYRALDAYIVHYQQLIHDVERGSWLERLWRSMRSGLAAWHTSSGQRASVTLTQIISSTRCQRYVDGELVDETINRFGRIPVVHIQNLSQPLVYHGLSDVEPLIPLQDELNTRLCDRANRVTMQSFRMWLAKGIENFAENPIGPGQMWATDNTEASIEPFGGDADSPSEKQHIEELREALDKASGVTPAAAGHIKARVGNLTSENALRISLMGTIAKTKRKRVTYGQGIAQLCQLILHALDVYGLFPTKPHERAIDIVWPDPIATDESRRIADALAKAQLGIPASTLRAELGYPD